MGDVDTSRLATRTGYPEEIQVVVVGVAGHHISLGLLGQRMVVARADHLGAGLVRVATTAICQFARSPQRLVPLRTDIASSDIPLHTYFVSVALVLADGRTGQAVSFVLQLLVDAINEDVAKGVAAAELPSVIGRAERCSRGTGDHVQAVHVRVVFIGSPRLDWQTGPYVLAANTPDLGIGRGGNTGRGGASRVVQRGIGAGSKSAEARAIVPKRVFGTAIEARAARRCAAGAAICRAAIRRIEHHSVTRSTEHLQVATQTSRAVQRIGRVEVALVQVFVRTPPDATPAVTHQADMAVTVLHVVVAVDRCGDLVGEVELQAATQVLHRTDGNVGIVGVDPCPRSPPAAPSAPWR